MASSQPAKGCFKCRGTGHWARDCPADPNSKNKENETKEGEREWKEWKAPLGKKKAAVDPLGPKRIFTRPKLTEELLLSKDRGIGFILQEFPKLMVIKGKGHEVGDLQRLLELYQRWHKKLFPSVAYPEFVEKVERLGVKKRVRSTVRELRHRVMHGDEDPFEPADEEPTAWGTAWEQQTEAAAKADAAEDHAHPWEADRSEEVVPDFGTNKSLQASTDAPPAATSGGLTAEQKARIAANKARALALQRERAAMAAEARAAGGESAANPVEAQHKQPNPQADALPTRTMRQRLADNSDDDTPGQHADAEPSSGNAPPSQGPEAEEMRKRKAEKRGAEAEKKRARKVMLEKLAQKLTGDRQDNEEEENAEQLVEEDLETASKSDASDDEKHAVSGERDSGTQQAKRRRLQKKDVAAEETMQDVQGELMDDVEAPVAKATTRGRRHVLVESDEED